MMKTSYLLSALALWTAILTATAPAQESTGPAIRGSLVEDRAARKLLEAGDTRFEADEIKEALEVWKSVIERYPRSRVRFDAHMRLGNYYLERDRAYDRARANFEAVVVEENRDESQQAEATLKVGICFYEARIYGKCFTVMRDVIEKYPVSPQVNEAYHYIGLGHFQLGHYSRAIAALEKVGTALESEDRRADTVEAGKRLFIKIDDADLAALETGTAVKVRCEVTSGDVEVVECFPVGRNVRVVLGSMLTRLGKPKPNNGRIDLKGDDKVRVTYIDQHTADKNIDRPVLREISVVGTANVAITDGAFAETLQGVVLGKAINIQINDADRDLTDDSDSIQAVVEVYRRKTEEEIESETAALAAASDDTETPEGSAPIDGEEDDEPKIDPLKKVDSVTLTLSEVKKARGLTGLTDLDGSSAPFEFGGDDDDDDDDEGRPQELPGNETPGNEKPASSDADAKPADEAADKEAQDSDDIDSDDIDSEKKPEPKSDDASEAKSKEGADEPNDTAPEAKPAEVEEDDGSIHTGVFQGQVPLVKIDEQEERLADDDQLQGMPGDVVRVVYIDERHSGEGVAQRRAEAKCVEGNIGGVRVTRAVINDQELRLKTRLKTADALTNIGNRYKEFGLKKSAASKYKQALEVCDEIMIEARRLGGSALEQTYVQLWKVYFQMDRLDLAAAMAQRLQREFPGSGFVDDALLQLGNVARKETDYQRAIGIYSRLVNMKTSELRGEAQFGIAECYDEMADAAEGAGKTPLKDRAFQEYKKVFDQFPESGRIGEAVSKMAEYYYQQKDYSRAIDTFETVLNDHPDAKFLDIVLFNYGRCLYRMGRRGDARRKFDQLIGDFPQSGLAKDAKKISDALAKAGS